MMIRNKSINIILFYFLIFSSALYSDPPFPVVVGLDELFTPQYEKILKGKKIGLITNHTSINRELQSSITLFKEKEKSLGFKLTALFAPEHGLKGSHYAAENVKDHTDLDGIPIYSLHGDTRRPTAEMLLQVDLLVYDIQDIGTRSYTYVSTLFYAMEEAAKKGISFIVTDRPNPINGIMTDGPMLDPAYRSFVGYINVPYCHGMTVGELAQFFNEEYKVGCKLIVIPMKGWRRDMSFQDTGLPWIPTSPHIPDSETPLFYPITGILGELQLVSIGIGYTLPFKVIGSPWINAELFAQKLNSQKFPGVFFYPFYYRPFFGRFARENCQGVLIVITNPKVFRPVSIQYLILGTLKNNYPEQFEAALAASKDRKNMFSKVNGTSEIYDILKNEKNIIWKLKAVHQKEREAFHEKRKKYLIEAYSS